MNYKSLVTTTNTNIKTQHVILLRYLLIVCLFQLNVRALAQEKQIDIKQTIRNIQAFDRNAMLRDADSIIVKTIDCHLQNNNAKEPPYSYDLYRKTSVDIIVHKDSIESQREFVRNSNDFVSKHLLRPLDFCFDHARSNGNSPLEAITILLYEDFQSAFVDNKQHGIKQASHASRDNGIFEVLGHQNIAPFLDESFGDIDLFKERNSMMLMFFKGPLCKANMGLYTYKHVGEKQIGENDCAEIFFYSTHLYEKTFSGYLYITKDQNPKLIQAKFAFNNPESTNFLKNVFMNHTFENKESKNIPVSKESMLSIGNENRRMLTATRTDLFYNYNFATSQAEWLKANKTTNARMTTDLLFWEQKRPIALTQSQMQVDSLRQAADMDKGFRRLENVILLALNESFSFGGLYGKIEAAPLTHFVSYNKMEGMRLRVGGNTTINFSKHFQTGGYLAYGTTDEKLKYQLNLSYSPIAKRKFIWEYPKKVFSFVYASDLNIPGQDVLQMKRDHFSQSFSHAPTDNMSLQQIGLISFENENKHNLGYKIGGKFTYDKPLGMVKYIHLANVDTLVAESITSSELQFSLRYAPGEKFIQRKEKRTAIRRALFEVDFTHRIGIKGLFGADNKYQISNFTLFKRFPLYNNSGQVDVYVSGGKIWGQIPFPLLFIPEGNQSYMFSARAYNCMNFYEFVTDRFVSTSVNTTINWSPARLFIKNDKMKIGLGSKMIYGPLSDKNNPSLHPQLFMFNNGIKPLKNVPYAEVNIGLANIFKVLRIDYSRRITYTADVGDGNKITKGTFLFSGSFSF